MSDKTEAFEVATPDGAKEVQARRVHIFKYIETYVHRCLFSDDRLSNTDYTVTEITTGQSIATGVGEEGAISNARQRLMKVGKKRVLEVVAGQQKLLRFR